MATNLSEIKDGMHERELLIVAPIFCVDESTIDFDRSVFQFDLELLRISLFSRDDVSCAFQIVFGRDENGPEFFAFSFGLGAEFCDAEPIENDADATDLAGDVDRFLRSNIRCERWSLNGKVVEETYFPNLMIVDGSPLYFTFRATRRWPTKRYEREDFSYLPWKSGDRK